MLNSQGSDHHSVDAIAPYRSKIALPQLNTLFPTLNPSIRSSLQASTWDGVFAAVFSNIAGGILLSNFLVDLHASTFEIGLLAAIPMLVNLLQPLGACFSERTTSRHFYGLWIFGSSRLLWLILACAILFFAWQQPADPHTLILWVMGVVITSSILGALGSASWLSWMAALVPARLRGRYFGFRNSVVNLATLICIPLVGWCISSWPGGAIQGYGLLLIFGVVIGMVSLGCQFWMKDVNPQEQQLLLQVITSEAEANPEIEFDNPAPRMLAFLGQQFQGLGQQRNILIFLGYFGFWTFAVNLSSPFFNIYLLDNLAVDIKWVTLYNSFGAASSLLMLVIWGKISDRIGNRPVLLLVGMLVAVTPLLWLGIGTDSLSLWVLLPLLHIFSSGTWAAIDLCSNNIQMSIAPKQHCTFFAIAAAVAGGSGALGTLVGGSLAQLTHYGGLPGMFALSSIVRLLALLPLIFVYEQRGYSVMQVIRTFSSGQRRVLPQMTLAYTPELIEPQAIFELETVEETVSR